MAGGVALPLEVTLPARRQLDSAHAWWQIHRSAAPNAIREDFESMARMLVLNPNIGRRATNTRTPHVRQAYLPRVGYVVYYRVTSYPLVLEVMAFWHSRRGKGPPI